ncbi:MAG: phage late control D family protein [Clostridia bacterium]|nr:phage late control D family protein [Clostridia bacterium]
MARYNFEDLSKKYKNFLVPSYEVLIEDKNIVTEHECFITGLSVDLSCEYKASLCQFHIENILEAKKQNLKTGLLNDLLKVGNKVSVSLGYGEERQLVFKGYISTVEVVSERTYQPYIEIGCFDGTNVLMIAKQSIKYKEATKYSDAVTKRLKDYTSLFSGNEVTESHAVSGDIVQQNETDYEFIRGLGKLIGYELFVEKGKIFFRPIGKDQEELILIKSSELLLEYYHEVNLTEQYNKVVVKGHHIGKPSEEILAEALKSKEIGSGSKKPGDITKIINDKNIKEIYFPKAGSKEEAQKIADAQLLQLSMNFVKAKLTMTGLPEMLPGYFISVEADVQTDQHKFYVTNVIHDISKERYETRIIAKANRL